MVKSFLKRGAGNTDEDFLNPALENRVKLYFVQQQYQCPEWQWT